MNAINFPLLTTRKVAFFSTHDAAWMEDIEYNQGKQHRDRIQAVLIRLVIGNIALEPLRIFTETKDDSHLCTTLAPGYMRESSSATYRNKHQYDVHGIQ